MATQRVKGFVVVALAGLASATAAHAQVITDGDSLFNMPATATTGATIRTGTGGGAGSVFTAGGSVDQLFQQWFWYRVNGTNTREFALSTRTSNVASGNVLTLEFAEPEGVNFRVVYTLTDGPNVPAQANLKMEVHATNTTSSPMSLSFFNYLDYDLDGLSNTATLTEPGRILVRNPSTGFEGEFYGVDITAYQVASFATLRTLLTDTVISNFGNVGLPFGPADWTGGFQWNLDLNPGQTKIIRSAMSYNMRADAGGDNECRADWNGDGQLDFFDYLDFVSDFSNDDADYNGDGQTDFFDYLDFVSDFSAGCD